MRKKYREWEKATGKGVPETKKSKRLVATGNLGYSDSRTVGRPDPLQNPWHASDPLQIKVTAEGNQKKQVLLARQGENAPATGPGQVRARGLSQRQVAVKKRSPPGPCRNPKGASSQVQPQS